MTAHTASEARRSPFDDQAPAVFLGEPCCTGSGLPATARVRYRRPDPSVSSCLPTMATETARREVAASPVPVAGKDCVIGVPFHANNVSRQQMLCRHADRGSSLSAKRRRQRNPVLRRSAGPSPSTRSACHEWDVSICDEDGCADAKKIALSTDCSPKIGLCHTKPFSPNNLTTPAVTIVLSHG